MAKSPVSVILLTYNEEKNIVCALRSVASGSVLPAAILVIDNGSTDFTQAHVQGCAQEFPGLDIRWVSSGLNNLGAARALGVRLADTPLIAFLDADCAAPPRWLERLLAGFDFYKKRDARLAGVGGMAPPPEFGHSFYQLIRLSRRTYLGHLNSPQSKPFLRDSSVDHLPTANALFSRAALLECGNFDPSFARVCEDVEIGCRLRARGAKLIMLHDAEVEHFQDTDWGAWAERIFRFGYGQCQVASRFGWHFRPRLLLPLIFILIFFAALCASWWDKRFFYFPLFYFVAVFATASWLVARHGRLRQLLPLSQFFVVTHFAYALGESWGLLLRVAPRLFLRLLHSGKKIFASRALSHTL